jgi:hypothetical protein
MAKDEQARPRSSFVCNDKLFLILATLAISLISIVQVPTATAAPPTITGTPPGDATVGELYDFRPQAGDPDGDSLRFWIWNRPRWASFNYRTGRLMGTPAQHHIGTMSNIVIGVSEGRWRRGRSASLPRFSIRVRAAGAQNPPPTSLSPSLPAENAPPTISGLPPAQVVQGQPYRFTPLATDPDDDALSFSISRQPAWADFDAGTGQLSGTPDAADVGSYANVIISVSDGTRSVSLAPFAIAVVSNAGGSATLSWQPPTARTDGGPLDNLAGFRILWGTTRGDYPNDVRLDNPGLTSYVVDDLTPATYYFVVVAFDSNGLESGYSNVGQKTIRP